MKNTITPVLATVAAVLMCNLTSAVEYQFAGTVTSVPSAFTSHFAIGEIVSGRMSLTPLSSSSTVAHYSVSNFNANIGGHYPINSGGGSFAILNNFGGVIDQVKLDITRPAHTLESPSISSHVSDYFHFNLLYDLNDLSSTNLLPQFVFDTPLDRSGLRFDVDDSLSLDFDLYDLSLIPEPNTLCLTLVSCGVLIATRKRR